MIRKKLLLSVLFFSFMTIFGWSQAENGGGASEAKKAEGADSEVEKSEAEEKLEDVETEIINIKGKEYTTSENFSDFIRSLDFIYTTGPQLYVNTKKEITNAETNITKIVSAPSPIMFNTHMGILWPNYTFVSMEPSLSFYTMYFLWYDGMALPAEIENRTVLAMNFMVELPVVIQLYLPNLRFQFSFGIDALLRFGMLADSVSEDDTGYSGTAGSDFSLIEEWFWSDNKFWYISAGASCLFNCMGNVKAGPEAKVYIPIASLGKDGFQGMLINIGMKISL